MNVWQFLLTGVLAVTVPIAGFAFTSIAADVKENTTELRVKGERLASTEAEVKALHLQLDRIEDKLDFEIREHHSPVRK